MNEIAIKIRNVSKVYRLYKNQMQKVFDFIFSKSDGQDFYALENISIEIEKGICVGLVGTNGSGKTTLANLISGISSPSEGEIEVTGSVSVIAISAGLNPQLTGIENIELKGIMLGLSKREIAEKMNSIIEFSGIGNYIYQPVKSYSSGMKSRLGFAISVNVDPDILIIDEALSVGDAVFAEKCLKKMNEFKEKGKTIIFVSHSNKQVSEFCDKCIWLNKGHIVEYEAVDKVIIDYERFIRRLKDEKQKSDG